MNIVGLQRLLLLRHPSDFRCQLEPLSPATAAGHDGPCHSSIPSLNRH
jgi:hypothetical protein